MGTTWTPRRQSHSDGGVTDEEPGVGILPDFGRERLPPTPADAVAKGGTVQVIRSGLKGSEKKCIPRERSLDAHLEGDLVRSQPAAHRSDGPDAVQPSVDEPPSGIQNLQGVLDGRRAPISPVGDHRSPSLRVDGTHQSPPPDRAEPDGVRGGVPVPLPDAVAKLTSQHGARDPLGREQIDTPFEAAASVAQGAQRRVAEVEDEEAEHQGHEDLHQRRALVHG